MQVMLHISVTLPCMFTFVIFFFFAYHNENSDIISISTLMKPGATDAGWDLTVAPVPDQFL